MRTLDLVLGNCQFIQQLVFTVDRYSWPSDRVDQLLFPYTGKPWQFLITFGGACARVLVRRRKIVSVSAFLVVSRLLFTLVHRSRDEHPSLAKMEAPELWIERYGRCGTIVVITTVGSVDTVLKGREDASRLIFRTARIPLH